MPQHASPEQVHEEVLEKPPAFHAWQSKVKNINKPDQIIFDLDPSPEVPFKAVKIAV